MNYDNYILPVTTKPPITCYKNYAYPLCILFSDDLYKEWLYNHFGNIYLMRRYNNFIWLDFLEPNDWLDTILEIEHITLNELKGIDIIELIRNTISKNKYVSLYLDEYYMSKTFNYRKKHSAGEFFIYGYDDKKRIFYTVGFNSSEYFGILGYSYDEIITALYSLTNGQDKIGELPAWVKWYAFSIIKKKNNIKVQININNIIKEFEEYTLSVAKKENLRDEIVASRGDIAIYGASCQEEVLKSLYEMMNNDKFYTDYRHIHILYEHKKSILEKMKYVSLVNEANVDVIISRYNKEVMNKMKCVKSLYLKGLILDHSSYLYDKLTNKTILSKLINLLEDIVQDEAVIFNDYLMAIK